MAHGVDIRAYTVYNFTQTSRLSTGARYRDS